MYASQSSALTGSIEFLLVNCIHRFVLAVWYSGFEMCLLGFIQCVSGWHQSGSCPGPEFLKVIGCFAGPSKRITGFEFVDEIITKGLAKPFAFPGAGR